MVAINESWRLCPWADVLYGCDGTWWKARGGVQDFAGLKLSQDTDACTRYRDVHNVRLAAPESDRVLADEPGVIGSGCNSGFQALNVAVQFGARGIALVGFDMRVDRGVHWHGHHQSSMNNPGDRNVMKWRKLLDSAASDLTDLGIEVINCSLDSALTAFPKMTIEQALERWKLQGQRNAA